MRKLVLLFVLSGATLLATFAGSASAAVPQCFGLDATITGTGTIVGTSGNDVIVGSAANDTISGGGGDDRVIKTGTALTAPAGS